MSNFVWYKGKSNILEHLKENYKNREDKVVTLEEEKFTILDSDDINCNVFGTFTVVTKDIMDNTVKVCKRLNMGFTLVSNTLRIKSIQISNISDRGISKGTNQVYDLQNKVRVLSEEIKTLTYCLQGGVICCRDDYKFQVVNLSDSLITMLGYKREEYDINNLALTSLIHISDRVSTLLYISQSMDIDDTFNVEFRMDKSDGSTIWVQAIGRRVYNKTSADIYIYITNIDEKKRLEQELEIVKERFKDELMIVESTMKSINPLFKEDRKHSIEDVFYEIDTPLNVIIGMSKIATESIDDKNKVKECLLNIYGNSKSISSHIRDILDIASIYSDEFVLNQEKFDMLYLVNELVLSTKYRISDMNLRFSYSTDPRIERYYVGDILRIGQALNNIISNSIKYNVYSGEISMEIKLVKDEEEISMVCVIICDTGIGISNDDFDKIFEPFWKKNTDDIMDSTGLGLTISKMLIEKMGGSISVDSRLGRGSRFEVFLPLKKADLTLGEERTLDKNIDKMKILTIYANGVLGKRICQIIRETGAYAINTTDLPDEVDVDILKDKDMVLVDSCYSEESIKKMTYLLKHNSAINPVVILLACQADDDNESKLLRTGTDEYIVRPMFKNAIFDLILRYSTPEKRVLKIRRQKLSLMGKKVMLVEDNKLDKDIALALLTKKGLDIVSVENGKEALETFASSKEREFDAILMNIRMPVMDGYTASNEIRKLDRMDAESIPILAVSSESVNSFIEKKSPNKIDAFINKPYDIEQMCRFLEAHINNRNRA